jgi:hypothetical protein
MSCQRAATCPTCLLTRPPARPPARPPTRRACVRACVRASLPALLICPSLPPLLDIAYASHANVYDAQTRDPTDCMHFCSSINNESATVDHPCKEGSDGTTPVRGIYAHAHIHTFNLPKLPACLRACVP